MADRVRMNTLSLATTTLSQTAVVLARRHGAAALEVARPQQLQLGRLVQPHRLDRPGVDVRLGPAPRGRQRGQVADHGAAAREPGAQARRRPTSRRPRHPLSTCCACARRSTCCASARRTSSSEKVGVPEQRGGCHARRDRDAHRRPASARTSTPRSRARWSSSTPRPTPVTQTVGGLAGRGFALTAAQADGSDAVVKTTTWDAATGTVTVPARSVAVLVDQERWTRSWPRPRTRSPRRPARP